MPLHPARDVRLSAAGLPRAIRGCLPPLLLAAVIAVVWVLPYDWDCDSLARLSDPAVARAGDQCVRQSDYSERLRIIEAGMEHAVGQFLSDAPGQEYLRTWFDRVRFYGPETIALSEAIRDAALYQRAIDRGYAPSDEEVALVRDSDRLRSEHSGDYIMLVKLAQDEDLAGFTRVLSESRHPDLRNLRDNADPATLMASLAGIDWRPLEESLKEGEEYLQSIGVERYWQNIVPAKLRRDMAIDRLEEAVLSDSEEGPFADVVRLGWLDYQQQVLTDADIALTEAAPAYIYVHKIREYLSDLLEAERKPLEDEYRRFQQRSNQRQRQP